MKPKNIFLIRHGQSEGNIDNDIYNEKQDYLLELTEEGKQQATEAGEKLGRKILKNERIFFYVSPYWRTRKTFELVARPFGEHFEWREDPRIREQEWGHWKDAETNREIDQERDKYGPFYYRIADGESCADVYDRVSDFFNSLHRDFEKPDFPENVVIVTHGMTLRVFLMRWFHWTVEEFQQIKNPANCEIVHLEKNDADKYDLKSILRQKQAEELKGAPVYTWGDI